MRKVLFIAVLAVLVTPVLYAQASDSHTVTVTVSPIDTIDVSDAQVDLAIAINVGTGTGTATDNTSTLQWATNQSTRHITVETSLATINYPLYVTPGAVSATSPVGVGGSAGTPGAEVELNTSAQTIVTGIGLAAGTCHLVYRATASVADPTGTDTHTVTYTITP